MKIGIHTNKNKDINFEITSKLISLGVLENIEIESAMPNKKYDLLISLGGDGTLLNIAKKYSISCEKIALHNKLEDEKILPGSKIFIPSC